MPLGLHLPPQRFCPVLAPRCLLANEREPGKIRYHLPAHSKSTYSAIHPFIPPDPHPSTNPPSHPPTTHVLIHPSTPIHLSTSSSQRHLLSRYLRVSGSLFHNSKTQLYPERCPRAPVAPPCPGLQVTGAGSRGCPRYLPAHREWAAGRVSQHPHFQVPQPHGAGCKPWASLHPAVSVVAEAVTQDSAPNTGWSTPPSSNTCPLAGPKIPTRA